MNIKLYVEQLEQRQLLALTKACVKEYNACASISDGELKLKHEK